MAKEMVIIFVYDTQLLKKEEDDPASAILYFHPTWVSDQQRTALCGQIMGTVHCLKSVLKTPKIVSLQSGKFFVIEYGRYTLAVGTDRNISNWVLEHRASTLTSLISFFHKDLEKMSVVYKNRESFSAKLYHMFETYLKILLYNGSIFSNIAAVQLPKSASNVFLEAVQILQTCQEYSSVLGGTLLYHNKIVATQISSNLTKRLVLTDPYRIKSPAETLEVNYALPLGVQLLQVYIDSKEYGDLLERAHKYRRVFDYTYSKSVRKVATKPPPVKEPVISAMKRDRSLLFTAVPEEDADHQSPVNIENAFVNVKFQNRPKSLNLRIKTTDTNAEEPVPIPSTPYLGQTSVCSTPMADVKRVLHSGALSICTGVSESRKETVGVTDSFKTESVNSILSAVSEDYSHTSLHPDANGSIKTLFKCTPYVTVSTNPFDKKKSSSMWDMREKIKNFAKRVTMKYYKPKALSELEQSPKEAIVQRVACKTITDPTFPVFRGDGKMISQSLYESYVKLHLHAINSEIQQNGAGSKQIENFDTDFEHRDFENPKNKKELLQTITKDDISKQKTRRSLSLPLKSLTKAETPDAVFSNKLLTPLMSKLSVLAMEEKSSGFCNRVTTPSEYKEFPFTPTQKSSANKLRTELRRCVLFVCGQQDTVVNILLEEDACCTSEVVTKLWDVCTEHLGKLERQLQHCLETYPGNSSHSDSETYSYLCVDPEWDTTKRGGPWGGAELRSLTHLHRDFIHGSNLMEVILRSDDGIIYGHHLGGTEVYYHQPASGNAGLPTPADPMGSVPLKAKRRLERDHAIMLL